MSWLGSDVPVAGGARSSVSRRSTPVETNHLVVDLALGSGPDACGQRGPFGQLDDVLVWFYVFLGKDRPLLPPHTHLYNEYVRGTPEEDLDHLTYDTISLRNIRVGKPMVISGLYVGGVSRFMTRTFVQNLGGRKTNTPKSFVHVDNGHPEGKDYFAFGCTLNPPLLDYCRIVYIDTNKFHWCSIDSVAFHSFVWPQDVGKVKSIVRTLFASHCMWADVLIVRELCFGTHRDCFRANRVLENLLWNWSKMWRPYVVYQEGKMANSNCDLAPGWLTHECVYRDFCQCHLLDYISDDWHRPVSLYSNVVCRRFPLFERPCGCSHDNWRFPLGCGRNIKNREIAIRLSWIVMHVLTDTPPSVPRRGEPMVFVLTSKVRTPKWGRERLKGIKRRHRIKEEIDREFRGCLWARGYFSGGCSEDSSEEEYVESDGEESS